MYKQVECNFINKNNFNKSKDKKTNMKKEDMLNYHKHKSYNLNRLELNNKHKEEIYNLKNLTNNKHLHRKNLSAVFSANNTLKILNKIQI